ncbi:MAG: hypothetical protein Q9209_006285 [Squamulea sp. 1 TL-2023]
MIELRGGKTAPRLLDDLNNYDPRRPSTVGNNLLVNLPKQNENGELPIPVSRHKNQCRHQWDTKDNQCHLPLIIGRPDPKAVSTVAAFCEHCMCHLDLSIEFPSGGASSCPSQESPLHHFVYCPQVSQPRLKSGNAAKVESSAGWEDLVWFQCSTTQCSARLRIRTSSPHLRPNWVDLLTNKELIKMRAEKAMSDDPARFEGHAVPFPSEVLSNLRTYILNALRDDTRRTIPAHNKRWLLCLGDPCAELLEYIGFVREGDDWLVPRADTLAVAPVSNPINVLLEDVEKELLALLLQRPDDEKRALKVQDSLTSASQYIGKALGADKYDQNPASRTNISHDEEHPFYPTLGAKLDFHDDLIKFAYERQIMSDPEGTPYYLEALQGIAGGRKSEDLQTSVAIEASSGKVSAHDIRNAYNALGLDLGSEYIDDDHIVGTFQSRAADSPRQEPELRRALQIIGQHRSSERIQSMASKTVTNIEQALSWLGATDDMDDNFVLAMYKVKEDENPAEEATARHAVTLIAQHRNSGALKQWLETGILGEVDMDVGQAYNRLQIDDRTIDDDFVLTAFDLHYQEAPSQIDDLRSALKAIAKDRNSSTLNNFLNSNMGTSEYPLAEWPVGLRNIGNTCYLNSLLQFYFTIKPFRELVLDFDEYKRDATTDNLKENTIGSRNVSKHEVQRAQKFVCELQKLFQGMITSPKTFIEPELELARLTLLSQPVEADLRRSSTIGGQRPSLGEINGRPILGPAAPPNSHVIERNENTNNRPAESGMHGIVGNGEEDRSSEPTLLGNDPAEEAIDQKMSDLLPEQTQQQSRKQQLLDDKENLPPSEAATERSTTPGQNLDPFAKASSSCANEQHSMTDGNHQLPDSHNPNKVQDAVIDPPSRPPPYPPRPLPEENKDKIIRQTQEIQMGAQQDVTEVISNVLYQLECAIKATSFDTSGEQIDQIKDMFFGKTKSYTQNLQGDFETKEQFFSYLFVDVASGPKNIYEALDGAFDVQQVQVDNTYQPQYSTISQLPPVLNVLVQRAQFDQKQSSAFKSVNHLELEETIYMDRYVDSDDMDLIQRRTESWEWKQQLRQLEAREADLMMTDLEMDVPDLLNTTISCLDQLSSEDDLGVTVNLQEAMKAAAVEVREELNCNAIKTNIRDLTSSVRSQFVDRQTLPYRLQSAFIHRGDATSGHYWIYIRDFKRNMWRKYDDEKVSQVINVSQIFDEEKSKRPATPYFLVYVRDDLKDAFVDPVCRELPEQPTAQNDVMGINTVMKNVPGNTSALYRAQVDGGLYKAQVQGGQGTTAVSGNWFEADYVKPQSW